MIARPARAARSGSSARARPAEVYGRPSPRFLAMWAPKRATAPATACWYCETTSHHSSESSCRESGVEPTRSQNITVSWRRSPAAAAAAGVSGTTCGGAGSPNDAPHLPQKSELARFSALHFGHCFASAFPHFTQKLLADGLTVPHFEQRSSPTPRATRSSSPNTAQCRAIGNLRQAASVRQAAARTAGLSDQHRQRGYPSHRQRPLVGERRLRITQA